MKRKNIPAEEEILSYEDQLAAWNEWRKWCSVMRVRDPRPTRDELERGLADSLRRPIRERYYRYMKKLIFKRLTEQRIEFADTDNESGDREEGKDYSGWDWIQNFDLYMRETKKRVSPQDAAAFAAGGNYKDFVFYLAGSSADDPLKVIIGKTVGKTGYLRDVIKRSLLENKILRSQKISIQSLDDDHSDDGNRDPSSLYDRIAMEEDRTSAQEIGEIASSFSRVDMVLMLAEACGIALDSEAVHSATGLKKSALAVRRQTLFGRVKKNYPEWVSSAELPRVLAEFFVKLQTEKSAIPFLNAIEEQEKRKALKRRTDYVED